MDWPSHCCFFSWPRPSFSWVNYGHRLTLPVWYYYWAGFFLHSCVPEWTMIGEHGPPHQKTFTWQLTLGEVRNILKWSFSKSLMLSFLVLNNWDWTKQEIGEECGSRAGCIDWELLELLLIYPDDLFTLIYSRWFYLLWPLPDGFIYFEPLQMMAQLPEEWKSKRSKSKKSGAGNKRPGFGSRCCLHSINLFAHLGFLNRDGN